MREVSEMQTFRQGGESRFRVAVTGVQQGHFLVNPEFPAKSVTQAEAKEATQLIYNLSSHLVSQRHTNLGRQASHKNQGNYKSPGHSFTRIQNLQENLQEKQQSLFR